MKSTLAALLIVGMLLWLWVEARRNHELASRIVRHALRDSGAQLLDDTVALQSMGLARTSSGRMAIRRSYQFEVSFDRVTREYGTLTLLRNSEQVLQLPEPPTDVM